MTPPATGPSTLTVTALTITGTPLLHATGTTTLLVATARMSDNTQVVVTNEAQWQTSKTNVATVAPGGVVTAVAGGTARITAEYGGRSGFLDVAVPLVGTAIRSVRVVYAVPQDRDFNPVFRSAIRNAMVDLQAWYGRQLNNASFRWHSMTPEECRLAEPNAYYGVDTWTKVQTHLQPCVPVAGFGSTVWVVYADVTHTCNAPGRLGAGLQGLTMLARQDLEGLAGMSPIFDDCGPDVTRPVGRWIGGLGHELGHAFGLPHPPGCDAGSPTCDGSALMWAGYANYPNTHLRAEEKATLLASPFFTNMLLRLGTGRY